MSKEGLKLNFIAEGKPPVIDLTMPLKIRFGYASKTIADYKNELMWDLELKQGQIFKLIGLLGAELANHEDIRADLLGEFIELLSELGDGFTEALGSVRERFDKDNKELIEKEKATDKSAEQVLDLSEHQTAEDGCIDLASQISSVLRNPHIPKSIYDAIFDGISSMPVSDDALDSPEYIAGILKEAGCQDEK